LQHWGKRSPVVRKAPSRENRFGAWNQVQSKRRSIRPAAGRHVSPIPAPRPLPHLPSR
jgi:hypothetical protein